jgi:hypothetical protein
MNNEYQCELCLGMFETELSEEEALKELGIKRGDEEDALVCEECYTKAIMMAGWGR